MPKKSSTQDKIYRFICKYPGKSTYYISKKLRMTGGRVRHALSKLKHYGLVKFKFDKRNPRTKKLSYPTDAVALLPRSLKGKLKKVKKK